MQQKACNAPFKIENKKVDPALIKEFTGCINRLDLLEVLHNYFREDVGEALTHCVLTQNKTDDFLTELNSLSEEHKAAYLQEVIDRDATIVSNVIRLANQYSGNIFHMGAGHCYDLIAKTSANHTYNDEFLFVWPISQEAAFHALFSLIANSEVLSVILNEMFPLTCNLTTLPENFKIANESTLYDIVATHIERYHHETKMDLTCLLQNMEDVEVCFTQFTALIDKTH